MSMKHPIQKISKDIHGVPRFTENKIIRHIIDNGSIGLNDLAQMDFDADDRMQLSQLIGYSVSGFGDLNASTPDMIAICDEIAETGKTEIEASIDVLQDRLNTIRKLLVNPVCEIFELCEEDVRERFEL